MEMKIMQPITVGGITLKNRIMFPPLTTGYEERDGSIGEQSRAFYTRLAQGGVGYIVLGDVAPIRSFSPTPKLFDDSEIESFRLLADRVHAYAQSWASRFFIRNTTAMRSTRFSPKGKWKRCVPGCTMICSFLLTR